MAKGQCVVAKIRCKVMLADDTSGSDIGVHAKINIVVLDPPTYGVPTFLLDPYLELYRFKIQHSNRFVHASMNASLIIVL